MLKITWGLKIFLKKLVPQRHFKTDLSMQTWMLIIEVYNTEFFMSLYFLKIATELMFTYLLKIVTEFTYFLKIFFIETESICEI